MALKSAIYFSELGLVDPRRSESLILLLVDKPQLDLIFFCVEHYWCFSSMSVRVMAPSTRLDCVTLLGVVFTHQKWLT